jgi:hypothetical protein
MLARISNKTIVEILMAVDGHAIEDCFHPSILAQCIPVPDGAEVGWTQQEDGSWVAPTTTDTGTTA